MKTSSNLLTGFCQIIFFVNIPCVVHRNRLILFIGVYSENCHQRTESLHKSFSLLTFCPVIVCNNIYDSPRHKPGEQYKGEQKTNSHKEGKGEPHNETKVHRKGSPVRGMLEKCATGDQLAGFHKNLYDILTFVG